MPTIISSSTQQQREGYPLNGWWSRGLTSYGDKNGDGIIAYNADPNLSEITVIGHRGLPRQSAAEVRDGGDERLRPAEAQRCDRARMVDYKGGFKMYNNTERIRCASRNNCSGLLESKRVAVRAGAYGRGARPSREDGRRLHRRG